MKEKEDNSVRQPKSKQIEFFFREKYEFRFNTIKCKPEFCLKNSDSTFSPISKFNLNSFKRELDTIGISTSSENIRTTLESDFSPKIHPFKEYFHSLPTIEPSENGYISQLSITVTVVNLEK